MRRLRTLFGHGLAALLLAACAPAQGSAPLATAPMPTAAAPASPPPTAAPPPTATPDAAETLARALSASANLNSYRMRFSLAPVRDKPVGAGGQLLSIKPVEYILVRDGEKSHVIGLGRQVLHIPGVDWQPPMAVEIIHAEGAVYAHGPIPLPGGRDAVWYDLGNNPPEGFSVIPPDGSTLLRLLRGAIDLREFTADGAEELDGRTCAIYRAGAPAALAAYAALGYPLAASTPAQGGAAGSGNQILQASMLFSLCDGYVRRAAVGVAGRPHGSEAQWFDLQANLIFADPGQAVITPPVRAYPLAYPNEVGTATVRHGGNVRATPASGEPQDQAHAGEKLLLYAQSADGGWILVVTPRGRAGWISATLITLDPGQAAPPVAEGFSTLAQGLPPAPSSTPESAATAQLPPPLADGASPSSQEFTSGPLHIDAPQSYQGGDMTQHSAEILAEMRALGAQYNQAASQIETSGQGIELLLYDSGPSPSNLLTTVVARRSAQPPGVTLADYVEQAAARLPARYAITQKGLLRTGDQPLGRIETAVAQGSNTIAQWILFLPYDGEIWTITFSTGASELEARRPQFAQMADSLRATATER